MFTHTKLHNKNSLEENISNVSNKSSLILGAPSCVRSDEVKAKKTFVSLYKNSDRNVKEKERKEVR